LNKSLLEECDKEENVELTGVAGQVAGTCGYGEGLSGSINVGNFLTSCKVYCLASQEVSK
jgi:hypothetical protein